MFGKEYILQLNISSAWCQNVQLLAISSCFYEKDLNELFTNHEVNLLFK